MNRHNQNHCAEMTNEVAIVLGQKFTTLILSLHIFNTIIQTTFKSVLSSKFSHPTRPTCL